MNKEQHSRFTVSIALGNIWSEGGMANSPDEESPHCTQYMFMSSAVLSIRLMSSAVHGISLLSSAVHSRVSHFYKNFCFSIYSVFFPVHTGPLNKKIPKINCVSRPSLYVKLGNLLNSPIKMKY